MKNYLKYKLFCAFINPLFFASALIFNILCPVYYFFVKNFFGGQGTSDLYNLFFIIPVISTVLIPILTLNSRKNIFEVFIPMCSWKKIIVRIESVFIQYVLVVLPQIFLPCCVNLFGAVDAGIAATGFFFIFLFGLACSSLCVFIETLSGNYQLALILNILCLGIANGINLFLIFFDRNPFCTAIAKFISFWWHFDSAGKGILDSRDIFYFIFTTILIVAAAFLAEEIKKGRKFLKIEKIQLVSIFAICVFGLLNATKFHSRIDISRNHKISVSKYTKNLLNDCDDFVKITYYKSRTLNNLYTSARDVSDFLQEFSLHKNVILEEKDPEKSNETENLKKYGIYGREFQTYGKNKTEFVTVYSTIIIEYAGVWDAIPFILSANSLEYSLDISIQNLMGSKKHIVNVLCGNGLDLEKDYSYVVPWLNAQGFVCNKIDLSDNIEEEAKYSNLLMIFGSSRITPEKCAELENFIEKGGKLFAFAGKYDTDIENNWYITRPESNPFIDLLEKYGFGFSENLVLDISCARITMQSEADSQGNQNLVSKSMNYPMWVSVMPQENAIQGITLFWPNALVPLNDDVQPLCHSSFYSWQVEPDKNQTQNLFVTNPFDIEGMNFDLPKAQNTVALTLTKNGESKIIVIPDQYFASSLMLGYIGGKTGDYRNLDFITNQILLLNGEKELAKLQEKASVSVNNLLYKTPDAESFDSTVKRTVFFMFVFIPLLIAGSWILLMIWRKKNEKCR